MALTRRQFMWGTTAYGVVYPLLARGQSQFTGRFFRHGVASGDPQSDRVVIWSRVTPPVGTRTLQVRWRMTSDAAGTVAVQSGTVSTTAERDYTVKIDVQGLRPGRVYHYMFDAAGEQSPVGRTKTLPVATDRLQIASISCANYP